MKLIILCFLLFFSVSINGQESELVVRYDFTEKASPPMKIFYISVFIDGIFADSTKPHMPHHNLSNAVHTKIAMGPHKIRIEGFVKDEKVNPLVINKVMEWNGDFQATKKKTKISIKMNGNYQVVVYTVPYD